MRGRIQRWHRSAAPVGLVVAVAVGVVARFTASSALWLDEALSVNIASLPLDEIPGALRRDGHPPLYYWLLHGWMAAFGDGDVAVRSLSGAIGVVALPLAWVAGGLLGSRRAATTALLVVALSPFAVRYATEARMYSLVMLLVLAGFVALMKLVRGGGVGWAVGLGAASGLLLWTHYWSIYLLAAVVAVLAWRWYRTPPERAQALQGLVAIATGSLPFVLWLPSLLEQAAHTGTPWAEPSRPAVVVVDTLDAMGGGAFSEARTYGIVLAVITILAAFTATGDDGRLLLVDRPTSNLRWVVAVVVGTLAVGTVVGYVTGAAFAARYAAVVAPLILLIAAVGLARRGAGSLVAGLTATLVVLGLVGMGYNATYDRTQAETLVDQIAAAAGPDDLVVVCPDQLGPSVTRALDQQGRPPPIPYPEAGDPRFVDWRDYQERNAAADPVAFADDLLRQADGAPIWFVWNGSYRTFEGQCEALAHQLSGQRPITVEATASEDVFEPALLYRFG